MSFDCRIETTNKDIIERWVLIPVILLCLWRLPNLPWLITITCGLVFLWTRRSTELTVQ